MKEYVQYVSDRTDELREHYPKAMATEIIQMEKGYRYCTTKSLEWLEQMFKNLETYTSTEQHPIARLVDVNTIQTNSLAMPQSLNKKKTFLQVASEASKDMAGDFFKAAQMELPKREEKK
jgi:hypothetical protein